MSAPRYVGMDGEPVWPHYSCPQCDALNPGVEQLHPRYGAECDECGCVLEYDWSASGEVGWCPAFPEEDE